MAVPVLKYEDVTPAAFKAIAVKVEKLTGVTMDTNTGEGSENGYTLDWTWSPETTVLTVECKKKPWYAPAGKVVSAITSLVDEAKAETA